MGGKEEALFLLKEGGVDLEVQQGGMMKGTGQWRERERERDK